MQVKFDQNFESIQSSYLLLQVDQQVLAQLKIYGKASLKAPTLNDECCLVTEESLFKTKRCQNQSMYLVCQSDGPDLTIKSQTSVVLKTLPTEPRYHEIYTYVQEKALKSCEIDLEQEYHKMFTFDEILDKFLISRQQLKQFLESLACYSYKGRFYIFDRNTHIGLLRLVISLVISKQLTNFQIKDLEIQEELLEEFISGALRRQSLISQNGIISIDFITIARLIVAELLEEKKEYQFGELQKAFEMMIPSYFDFDINNERENGKLLFYKAHRLQCVMIDTNTYIRPIKDLNGYIFKSVDKQALSNDLMERVRSLRVLQQKFTIEQLQEWLIDTGKQTKEVAEFIQKSFKIVQEQVHPQNQPKIQEVYLTQEVKVMKFYILK